MGPMEIESTMREGPLEPARSEDLPSILDLLARCGLPTEGVADHLGRFVVARENGHVIACTGVEVHGEICVLRSLAVAPEARGRGIARRLIERSLEMAVDAGCTDAYLLTLSVEDLAARYGFKRVTRDAVSASLLRSKEFQLNACATAIVMHRHLARPTDRSQKRS